jgi:hypothetical protein
MKPPFAHLPPTLLACAAAIAVALSVFLLSGAGSQGKPIPLLPALGGAAGGVAVNLGIRDDRSAPTPAAARVPTAPPVLVPTAPALAPHPAAHRVHRVHHARARGGSRVVRHAPPSPVQVAVSAPAPATPVSAPRPVSVPKSKGKTLGQRHGHARGHSPGNHQGLPPGQAKKPPAAPPKAKGGGPPADHGGGNGRKGDKK